MRNRSLALLLPLALAACASTLQPAARFGSADAVEVRFPRVAARWLAVQLREPAHATLVEVTPGSDTVAEWLGDAAPRRLPPGRHVVFQAAGSGLGGAHQSACDRPGERASYDWMTAPGSVSDMRSVQVQGSTVFCIRQAGSSRTSRDRHVLVLVGARGADAGALERARDAFNRRYAGSPLGGEELARAMAPFVAAQWPGSAVYYVRVRD